MKRFTNLIFITLMLSAIQLNAQNFKAYLAMGANITEANLTESGNSQVGTRLGLNIGSGVSVTIKSRWETSMELLYSQNGFYVNPVQVPTIALDKITLHYIEAPLTLGYRFNIKENEKAHFYKQSISGGIAYAHLFKHKVIAIDGTNVTNEFRFDEENALLFNFGVTSLVGKSFALNGRGTLSTFGKWTFALQLLYYINGK